MNDPSLGAFPAKSCRARCEGGADDDEQNPTHRRDFGVAIRVVVPMLGENPKVPQRDDDKNCGNGYLEPHDDPPSHLDSS